MRFAFWVLALAAAAVGLTLAARYDAGYVLIVVPPYRVELSLNLLVLALLVGFAFAYALVRIASRTLALPSAVREFRRRRRAERARTELLAAVRAFLENRFGRAEQAAVRALDLGEQPGISAAIAARSAHELKGYDRRDRHLTRATDPDDATLRLLAQAELLLDQRRAGEALEALNALPEKHTAALRLELRAQQMAKHWERVLELTAQLQRRGVFDATQAEQTARYAHAENLKRKALDAHALDDYWQRVPAPQRADARIAAAAAQCYIALGGCDKAHSIIETSLAASWDTELVGLYAECPLQDPRRQIEHAEEWLQSHPGDAVLLLTLGRLCAQAQLWGKAQSYLEASLSVEPSYLAHMTLAQLLEGIGRNEDARSHYRKSLELALEQLRATTGGRRRAAL